LLHILAELTQTKWYKGTLNAKVTPHQLIVWRRCVAKRVAKDPTFLIISQDMWIASFRIAVTRSFG
jgi:hypothetical protein